MNNTKYNELNTAIETLYREYRILKNGGPNVLASTFDVSLECLFASIQGVAKAAMKLEEVDSHEN